MSTTFYKTVSVTCGAAGEFTEIGLSATGDKSKLVKQVVFNRNGAANADADDALVYLDTDKIADVPFEMVGGFGTLATHSTGPLTLDIGLRVDVNDTFKVGIRSDAGAANYLITVVYEEITRS